MHFYTLLTQRGEEKIAQATLNKTTIELNTLVVGDGNGVVPSPTKEQTTLVNQVYEVSLSDLSQDETNKNWLVTTAHIPANQGNFWIREVGIKDSEGDLIAIGNYPETYKPVLENGVAKDLLIKLMIAVTSLENITLTVHSKALMATKEYVDNSLVSQSTGFKNLLINGDFRIWQRGENFITEDTVLNYTADRWASARSQVTKKLDNGIPYLKLVANKVLDDSSYILQKIELPLDIASKEVTLSLDVKSPNLISIPTLIVENEERQNVGNVSSTWSRISQTFTIESNINTEEFLFVLIGVKKAGIETGQELHIKNVQLEVGDKATNFEYRPYGLELSLCQRYYQKHRAETRHYFNGGGATHAMNMPLPFNTTMRIIPSLTSTVYNSTNVSSHGVYSTTQSDAYIQIIPNGTGSTSLGVDYMADAEIY